jgi:PTS system nitrogen regulatory IIA component
VQLTVRDVSRCFNVSEATVIRWVRQRNLPARQVAGQHRFNQVEVMEWATAHQLKISPEVFSHLPVEDDPIPSLADAIAEGGILYDLPGATKEQALRAVVDGLPLPKNANRELLVHLLLVREASSSTALGDGIAIPHVKNPIVAPVARPMITLAFLAQPIDFGAVDQKPVAVLFTIVSPTTRGHLQLLSRLSFVLHDPKIRKLLRDKPSRADLLRELRGIEATLAASGGSGGTATS